MHRLQNVNVVGTKPLIRPTELWAEYPISEKADKTVFEGREALRNIIEGKDQRFVAVAGPCSIHDPKAALEYAGRLKELADKVSDRILVIMRVYFEKPRTTVGWKGLINDPHLNDSFDIETGLRRARQILLEIAEMGLPAGTEMLEPITPQYISDLLTWASIGARTTESPTHRQMSSGLSMPVGFKNSTDGSVEVAVNAMLAAREPHSFLGIDEEGRTCCVQTAGNPHGHLILRGGKTGTNYDATNVGNAIQMLEKAQLNAKLLVDCSHANSEKDHNRQEIVLHDIVKQHAGGNSNMMGAMIESNLNEGKQKLTRDLDKLAYGVSITDACVSWEKTEEMLNWAYEVLGSPALAGKS